ncbi:heme biosynthesis protein HemY [Paracoccus bogoriensis]|uniref:heme biosynthesis protein HemY n=1 Tax=Paracoccus bogoriensis TaxID=242065 RepID=UPI001CA495A2|nr:heme biosynthesis HemY N-terminal domain-containing protein [Paracoccus bogoriensis]MBW7057108.1 heme biosynthesis protein HemY [Paracoccus bogoriensis]
MLLSFLKILFFFAVVLALAFGATWLSETGQLLRIEYGGVEYVLTPVKAVVALAILAILAWLVIRLLGLFLAFLRFLAGDETAINRYFARSRERKGYAAFAEGMLAVASGEGKLAQDKAAKAARYLNQPHLTNLLAAQAAETAGDRQKAIAVYRELLGDDRTRFVGIRGLMRQKLAEGDTHKALLLAQKAYALKPRHKEVQDTLLELQTREHDWKGARRTLRDKKAQGDLPKDVALRRDAVLALQEASEVLAKGNSISAREAAISAAKASPDLIPAAVLAARSYIAQKDYRNASRILEKTWSVRPHPDIAAAYAEIAPDESRQARLRRFEALIRKNPDHEETRLLQAELLLAAEDFPGARRALGDLATKHPTVRTLSIMAAIERGEGADDSVVRGWLTRALTASRGPQWCCDKCHNVMPEWAPVCDSCNGFDTLTWREPDGPRASPAPASAAGAEMLPLLVGASAPAPEKPAAPVAPSRAPQGTAPRAEPGPAPASRNVPRVAPGMVPRESDYDDYEPARTITEPSAGSGPVPDLTGKAEASPARDAPPLVIPETPPATAQAPEPADEPTARPAAEPLVEPAPKPEPEPEPRMVRPDVEPPEEADWTEGKTRP